LRSTQCAGCLNLPATVLPWAIGGFAIALLLNAWRLLRGPGVTDRILALDTLFIHTLALLVLAGAALFGAYLRRR
jgi:multicomponent K+:H+ antiporter subunit F